MEKEQETQDLKKKLKAINANIKGEMKKIDQLKLNISTVYRSRDKTKYEGERKEIAANLKKYDEEMALINKRLSELEAVPL